MNELNGQLSAALLVFFSKGNIQDGASKIAKLPYFSGFMVDITIVFMGVISWFINQQTYLGGPILYGFYT